LIPRRTLLAVVAAPLLRAQDRAAYIDILGGMAAALASAEPAEFMRYIDESAPDRERLRSLVGALLAQAEVTSSVEVIEVSAGVARADWYMEVRTRAAGAPIERRRRELTVKLNGQRRVTDLRPIDIFSPPTPRG
jgi:hypothetical protein